VTVAYTGTEQCDSLLRVAADLVSRLGTKMRLASFAVAPAPPVTAMFRTESAEVVAEWSATIEAAARRVLGDTKLPVAEVVIGQGSDWESALNDIDWHDGDLRVVGSSESGPIARVFLGSRAAKIIRHTPVPVLVIPRGAAEE
jgi:nucleotide-binding universal stress UspA family protein